MTCREMIEFLMDYLSGSLTEREKAVFDAHLAVCPSCVAYLETYGESIRMGKAAFARADEELPGEVPEELIEAILASRKKGT
jgi:predicted anti-sigma-YlaC factor YlaD